METIPKKNIFCRNCKSPIKLSGDIAHCKCRVRKLRILQKGFAVQTTKFKLSVRSPLAVIANGGQVNLVNSNFTIAINSKFFAVYLTDSNYPAIFGHIQWIPDIPFIKQLIHKQ